MGIDESLQLLDSGIRVHIIRPGSAFSRQQQRALSRELYPRQRPFTASHSGGKGLDDVGRSHVDKFVSSRRPATARERLESAFEGGEISFKASRRAVEPAVERAVLKKKAAEVPP